MTKLKMIALEADPDFQKLSFEDKLKIIIPHINEIARIQAKDPSTTTLITMREYFLGRNITPAENKRFKKIMSDLCHLNPSLVIIGNTSTVRYYSALKTKFSTPTREEIDAEDDWDIAPNQILATLSGVEGYGSEFHSGQKETESKDESHSLVAKNEEILHHLQAMLPTTTQMVKVGVMKNNTYVFQGDGYEYHTKKAPVDELTITSLQSPVLFLRVLNQPLSLDELRQKIPPMRDQHQMFVMDNKVYYWQESQQANGQPIGPIEVLRTAENNVHYDLIKTKLQSIDSPAKITRASNEELKSVTRITGNHFMSKTQVFCPASPNSKNVFFITTPSKILSLGIDTCREYGLGALKSSADEVAPPADVHLVLSEGMTFNGRPKESKNAANYGGIVAIHDKSSFGIFETDLIAPHKVEITAHTHNMSAHTYTLSEAELAEAKPLPPKTNLLARDELVLLLTLEIYIKEKKDPSLTPMKTAIPEIYQAGYGSQSGNIAQDKLEVYQNIQKLLSNPDFKPPKNHPEVAATVSALHRHINKNISKLNQTINPSALSTSLAFIHQLSPTSRENKQEPPSPKPAPGSPGPGKAPR